MVVMENKRENDTEEPRDIRFAVYVTKTRQMVLFKLLRQSDGSYEKMIQNMNPESPLIRFKGRKLSDSICTMKKCPCVRNFEIRPRGERQHFALHLLKTIDFFVIFLLLRHLRCKLF
jgi:hypothetical protein